VNVEEMTGLMRRIYCLAEADPRCKADDKYLVWKMHCAEFRLKFGADYPLTFAQFDALSTPDSITRIRRKLQSLGYIQPEQHTRDDRRKKRGMFRQWAKTPFNERLF